MFKKDRELSKLYYPIYKCWTFNIAFVSLLCPEDIELVLTSTKHIKKGDAYNLLCEWLGTGLLTSDGSKWHNRRKILTPAFHFNILQDFVNIFNKETENLVEVLAIECSKPYINVIKPITEYTLYSIGETSMGINLNEETTSKSYKEAIYKLGHNVTWRLVRPWFHSKTLYQLTARSKEDKMLLNILHTFSDNVIGERQKTFQAEKKLSYSSKKRLAMLDLLLTAKYAGADIDDDGIREEVDTFMFEGHDTTSMGICYILMTLANEKHAQEEILREIYEILGDSGKTPDYNDLTEMKYMERCIKECLRLYPSVPFIARVNGEEIKTKSGHTIPKGTNIHMHIYDLHRVPEYWEHPEEFNPDRFLPENIAIRHPFAYLPFSAGPRNCIGQRFAILEIKAALCGILRKFHLEPVDTPQDLRFKTDLVLRPYDEIKVKFVPWK
ncbi:hypothetical protein NQ314_014081 [Rhamnusium bicolor]|uniref:Cytochrome P450 n=1 Tax=Rhamnusium bicolor TaxID=1586634 RepID=A0AAV8X4R5_9CUCU|nr:hypothetical protein NQ314_014081 [Rhamnusium bicolor]